MNGDRIVFICDKWTKEFADRHEAYMYITDGKNLKLPDVSKLNQGDRLGFEESYRNFLDELAAVFDNEEFVDVLNEYCEEFLYEKDFRLVEEV